MKHVFLFLFLVTNLICFGQNKPTWENTSTMKFYGVDYSRAKVFGTDESPQQFKTAFDAINLLFISEPKKFNITKFIGKEVSEISLGAVNELNRKINSNQLITTEQNYTLNKQEIADAVRALPIKKEPGMGMVIIAKLLNKAANRGSYEFVFFNTETMEIITGWPAEGKAGGFGLRNFWAASIYKALKVI